MVSPNDRRQDRRLHLARVVPAVHVRRQTSRIRTKGRPAHLLGEAAELLVLVRDGHALEVAVVADHLEVAADEEVDGVAVLLLERGDLRVYSVELAVAEALDGDLGVRGVSGFEAVG